MRRAPHPAPELLFLTGPDSLSRRYSQVLETNERPNTVQAIVSRMTPSERGFAYLSAVHDGDMRRADEIALAPVPKEWPEHEKQLWRERCDIARSRLARARGRLVVERFDADATEASQSHAPRCSSESSCHAGTGQ